MDERFMRRALRLAARGQGSVEPNPMVGAVIVRTGRVIGEGWHRFFGGPHAEIEALRNARRHGGTKARSGAALFVTLEPCCHWGKTPPCTDAIIAAGVTRVVASMRDPYPAVAGGGFRRLREAGVRVEVGLLEDQARRLSAPFVKRVTTGRPWVILKWAQSLDGKIATRTGASKWISSIDSRRQAHGLRGRVDAVIVGVGTVLADDPELTCRLIRPRRVATRVVLDSLLRTPSTCRLVRTLRPRGRSGDSSSPSRLRKEPVRVAPLLIFTSRAAPAARRRRLEAAACDICVVPSSRQGLSLDAVLDELGRRGMTNVMVEGGGRVLGSFFDAGLADEAVVFVAPRLIGGAAAPGPLGGCGADSIGRPPHVQWIERRSCGPDQMWRLSLRKA